MRRLTIERGGFTLVELMATLAVLSLIVVLAAGMCHSAQWIQCSGNRRLDADSEARAVFDRMALDFSQMIRRADVDFWLKDHTNLFPGNDRMVFFSQVPGYYPDDAWYSPVSVVGYWVDPRAGLKRYGCGLLWNGTDDPETQMFFSGTSASSNASGSNALYGHWPEAVSGAAGDFVELAGPEVFRMEYYYILRADGSQGAQLSAVPWRTNGPAGLHDVAALGVVIALIDAKARKLVPEATLAALAANMEDFPASAKYPYEIEIQWRDAVEASGLPKAARSSIRVYRRWFYLSPSPLEL